MSPIYCASRPSPAHYRNHADSVRHGWGCEPIPEKAVFYLSAAAKNAADVESLALQAGLKKGGAAKGELVLAIFELANCFRQGWGIDKDPIAAKQVCDYLCSTGTKKMPCPVLYVGLGVWELLLPELNDKNGAWRMARQRV